MTQHYAWILNLDAELELARGRPGYVPQRKLLAQLAEHGGGARALLGPNDVELRAASSELRDERELRAPSSELRDERERELRDEQGEPPDPTRSSQRAARSSRIGRAWCPTPMALAGLRAHGVEPEPHPDACVLRRVNHRLFGHQLGGGLPEQTYVRNREQLLARIAGYSRHWLLKRPLGFAGRGQLRIIGPVTDKQWTWVDASLKRDGLLLEPLVTPTFEVSLHGFIWRDQRFELGRVCTQSVSERGAFRGARLAEAEELRANDAAAFRERAETVAGALASAGYFGPFGIDGYRYSLDGTSAFCALGEINARYTLGFAVGFPRHPSELSLG